VLIGSRQVRQAITHALLCLCTLVQPTTKTTERGFFRGVLVMEDHELLRRLVVSLESIAKSLESSRRETAKDDPEIKAALSKFMGSIVGAMETPIKSEWDELAQMVVDGYSLSEIAAYRGITPPGVRQKIVRAFRRRNPGLYQELVECRDRGCHHTPSMRLLVAHADKFGYDKKG